MPELRQDPTTKDWVVFATERAKRPQEFSETEDAATEDPEGPCPFCPGNEHLTPAEIDRLTIPNREGAPWTVRVVPNRFAALSPGDRPERRQIGPGFRRMAGIGAHEVVIESPDHRRHLADMTASEVRLLFEAYQRRYRALRRLPSVEAVVIFKNHGRRAGTSLRHPHSQIVASPVATPLLRRRYEIARAHYEDSGTCLYCELRDAESRSGERVLFEEEGSVAFHPYASRWPFETWIVPRSHLPSFGLATDVEVEDAAAATRRALELLRRALGDFPFNYAVHSAPVREEHQPFFVWHVQIVPRLTTPAGFELGSGMWINPSLPEETAAFLRDLEGTRSGMLGDRARPGGDATRWEGAPSS